jgi:hypothetical protein
MSMIALTNSGDVRNVRCSPDGMLRVAIAPPIALRYDIGAVAANAVVYTPALDLGADESRQHTLLMAIKRGAASSGELVTIDSSLDGADWIVSPNAAGATAAASSSGSSTGLFIQGRPLGRYVRLRYQNGSTAQTALILNLTAMAGV